MIFLPKTNSFPRCWELMTEKKGNMKEFSFRRNMMGSIKGETASQYASTHLYLQSEIFFIILLPHDLARLLVIIPSDLHFRNASILMTLVIIESMFQTQFNGV